MTQAGRVAPGLFHGCVTTVRVPHLRRTAASPRIPSSPPVRQLRVQSRRGGRARSHEAIVGAGVQSRDAILQAAARGERDHRHFLASLAQCFTFPDGKIDLPSRTSGRAGGVKYSDYAIGELLREAATKPWFKHTLFVFVGDHGASSAGKTELPVQNYPIPLLVYASGGQIQPGVVKTIAAKANSRPTNSPTCETPPPPNPSCAPAGRRLLLSTGKIRPTIHRTFRAVRHLMDD